MSKAGRPKKGQAPACHDTGPCLGKRIRRNKNTSTHSANCRNCAKPMFASLGSWIEQRAPDLAQWPTYLQAIAHELDASKAVALAAKSVFPHAEIYLPDTHKYTQTLARHKDTTRQWLGTHLDIGHHQDTFTKHTACIEDFIYCQRHSTTPSHAHIKYLLKTQAFQEASKLIVQYEHKSGERVQAARRFYNQQVRAYNDAKGRT